MTATDTATDSDATPTARLEVLFEQLAESAGQRNAIDGRIVEVVAELRTAVALEPRPDPEPGPDLQASITKTSGGGGFDFWRLRLPHAESATLEAALGAHRDALLAEWQRDRESGEAATDEHPPMPTTVDAFSRLVETGWDVEAARRPHGHRTTVVVHLDLTQRIGALHLGPLLSQGERRYLTCDASCEVWFERAGPQSSGLYPRLGPSQRSASCSVQPLRRA